eukprot:1089657-Pyramimonas_sp.AAC.1
MDLGRLSEARPEIEAALEESGQRLGEDHPEVATLRGKLGAILMERGQLLEARRELEAAARVLQPRLGGDHPEVARIRRALG